MIKLHGTVLSRCSSSLCPLLLLLLPSTPPRCYLHDAKTVSGQSVRLFLSPKDVGSARTTATQVTRTEQPASTKGCDEDIEKAPPSSFRLSGLRPSTALSNGLKRDKFFRECSADRLNLGRKTAARSRGFFSEGNFGLSVRGSRAMTFSSSFAHPQARSQASFLLNVPLLFQLPSLYLSPWCQSSRRVAPEKSKRGWRNFLRPLKAR